MYYKYLNLLIFIFYVDFKFDNVLTLPTMTPCIYSYDDYRVYIRDYLQAMKDGNPLLSNRFFAKKTKISAAFLKMVSSGQRNLSPSGIAKFSSGFGFNKDEKNFFQELVLFNQAELTEEKNFHFQNMAKHKKYRELRYLDSAQFEYCSKWYYSVIRELIACENFVEDPEWIAATLCPAITPKQAEEALKLLISLQLVRRDEKGRLIQNDAVISSGEKTRSLAMKNYHREMLNKAEQSIDRIAREERDLTAMTFAISEEDFAMVKHEIMEFRRSLISKLTAKKTPSHRVYQINFQLFPLTTTTGGKNEKSH